MRTLGAIGVAAALGLNAAAAGAASAPLVPRASQAAIRARVPVLAYVPTRIAIGFRYREWHYSGSALRISFRNRAGWEITFAAARFGGDCRAGMAKSFQLDGNKVYWSQTADGQEAWRCVAGTGGRRIRLAASSTQPPTRFAGVGLGQVVASGRRIA